MQKDAIRAEVIEKLSATIEDKSFDSAKENPELLGKNAVLNSLELVTFLVELEQAMNDKHNLEISLMDERAMSRTSSPFRSVTALVDYIHELTDGKANG